MTWRNGDDKASMRQIMVYALSCIVGYCVIHPFRALSARIFMVVDWALSLVASPMWKQITYSAFQLLLFPFYAFMGLETIPYLVAIKVSLISFLLSTPQSKIDDMKRIAMTEEQYRKVEQLHYGWYVQAVRALLGAVGKELYMKMDRNNRRAFVACLDSIDNEHDLQLGSQCLVKAFDGKLV
uniref:Receptor expression-enhancing protein n=1 Tax=Angiostrongylus cantonensis TaxID=6313 RepID=A0A158PCN6_ANGCA